MIRFEEPEIKVIKFATPDVLTLSMNESFEGSRTDKVVSSSEWGYDDTNLFFTL